MTISLATESQTQIRIPSYAYADLPTAGTRGRLAYVTDRRGIFADTGTGWFPLNGRVANVLEFGATGDGSTNDHDAFNAALGALNTLGGGTLLVPTGTYILNSSLAIPGDDIQIVGQGWNTIIRSGATDIEGLITATGRSRIALRNFKFEVLSGHSNSKPFVLTAGDTDTTDILLEDIWAEHQATTGVGGYVGLHTDAGTLHRVAFVRCRVSGTVDGSGVPNNTGTYGLGLSTSLANGGGEFVVDGCVFEGFTDGFTNHGSGVWEHGRVANSMFRNAVHHGARFYHLGELAVSNCVFLDNDIGAFFDENAGNTASTITGCRFISNTVAGAYNEEWQDSVFSGCVFSENGYGLWLHAGLNISVNGCTFNRNTESGVLIDKATTLSGNATYNPAVDDAPQGVVFSGCSISANQKHGIEVRGVQEGCTISGCSIINNGRGAATTYSGIYIGADNAGAGSSALTVHVVGCTIGKPGSSGATYTGQEKNGIEVAAGKLTYLTIVGNQFHGIAAVLGIGNIAGGIVDGNAFFSCDSVTIDSDMTYGTNEVVSGSLAFNDVNRFKTFTVSLTPSAVNANTSAEEAFGSITGIGATDILVSASSPGAPTTGTGLVSARVSTTDTIALTFMNTTAGSLTPTAGNYKFIVMRANA